jgi:FAD/FMN-containing dehydrogenase
MAEDWTNWSGAVRAAPERIITPKSEAELVDLVKTAARDAKTVRVAGTGHSFVPLCATDGFLVSLDGLQGVISADRARLRAAVRGGTKLHQLGGPLREADMAMENLGDIDRQSIAGVISTATHGTGHGIGNLANQAVGLRLITATGEVLECSPEQLPEVFKAAQVSLGALGIISQVTLRLVPAYRLHERIWRVSFGQCMAELERLIHENRHFEFFWSPGRDECMMKALNPTQAPPDALIDREGERIDHSDRVFPSVRDVKFNEIEFSVPEANGPACLRELRELMLTKHQEVRWPLEYRTVAADDIPLSPHYRRDSVAISAHQAAELPYKAFFADVEAVFRNHGGRPHWGKIHTHSGPELAKLYEKWADFHEIRRRLDPRGRFLNTYLRDLFAEA